jgi:signal transduction histidine kinase
MSATAPSVAELRAVDLFDELEDAQLAVWAAAAQTRELPAGAVLVEQDEPSRGLWLLLKGTVESLVVADGRSERIGHQGAPTWMGAIAALTEAPMGVEIRAVSACRVARVPPERFVELALASPSVHRRVMQRVGPVLSRLCAREQHRERLAALGTMAAGLAHELNNPAAAANRAASDLIDAIKAIGTTLGTFVEAGIEREDAEQLLRLQREALARADACTALDALDAADEEDAMRDRLEDLGVADAWRLAEPLARARVDDAWLSELARLAGPATDAALRWVAASLTARTLAQELKDSTERMGALVGAVKSYAYMDRGGLVEADVHEGLETTLVVLGHKLKHTRIAVVRDYDRTLPQLTVHGSELNQVWTNLLDNAIDALGDSGTITLRTRRDGACVLVDVADDGPGIPDELRARVLEPFFTTKEAGRGTGLGLDTARRIVEERHTGTLGFDSGPQGTTFHVWLAARFVERGDGDAERVGEAHDRRRARVLVRALDLAEVLGVDVGREGERLLRQLPLAPQVPDRPAQREQLGRRVEPSAHSHRPMSRWSSNTNICSHTAQPRALVRSADGQGSTRSSNCRNSSLARSSSALDSLSTVVRRGSLFARSISPTCFALRPASSASASCERSRSRRALRTVRPKARSCGDTVRIRTVKPSPPMTVQPPAADGKSPPQDGFASIVALPASWHPGFADA